MGLNLEELFQSTFDTVSIKDAVSDIALLEIESKHRCYHKVLVPTCSCDYVLWVSNRDKIICPSFRDGLKPTKIDDNDQCVYCGYYACWKKIDLFFFESSEIPFWSQEEWYRSSDSIR